ncbi:helix-hairpin-helix domain-containing protein [Streptomyces capillispiralis]|uniref:helix-hairpin-helix domain-containing protein n=1 Tax=Streptomyces capillispiralis TaxID=68182 RepID=UPI0036B5ABC3
MALRSRSRTATPTSGPGRGPASDGRARHRRPTGSRGGRPRDRHRDRRAAAEELRRRAESLFDEGGGDGAAGTVRRVPSWAVRGARRIPRPDSSTTVGRSAAPSSGRGAVTVGGDEGAADVEPRRGAAAPRAAAGRRRERIGLALRERLPVWVQARCGMERRSVIALSVLLVVAVGFAVQHFWAGRTQPVRAPEVVRAAVPHGERTEGESGRPRTSAGGVGTDGSAAPEIVVDVSGKVRDPGTHRLPAGSRVEDALRAAGGVRPGTRTDTLNRARFLVDGEQVVVGGPTPAAAPGVASSGTASGGSGGGAGTAAGAGPAVPVSLNTATLDQLDTLPGVGPVLAQHIVDYRTRNGGFRSVDELREVNGIGDRRFADLRDLVRP